MDIGDLQLKFGTALFTFRDEEQMKVFLESRCVRRLGKIHLHHGDKFHFFTELSEAYMKNVPNGVKVPNYTRYMVSKGGCDKCKKDNDEVIIADYAE